MNAESSKGSKAQEKINDRVSMWPRSDERGIPITRQVLTKMELKLVSMWPRSDERGIML